MSRVSAAEQRESYYWMACATAHLDLLNLLRRHADAAALGDRYAAMAERAGSPGHRIALARARAHAELGRSELAEGYLAAARQELQGRGAGGVVAAEVDEVGARVALLRGDRPVFTQRLHAWGECVQRAKNPQLAARYNALVHAGNSTGVAVDAAGVITLDEYSLDLAALRELARAQVDDATFYARLLSVLLEQTGAAGGVLYVCSQTGLRRMAEAGGSVFPRELDDDAARFWSQRTAEADLSTGSTQSGEADASGVGPLTGSGHMATVLSLDHLRQGVRLPQGVLVLDLGPNPRPLRVGLAEFGAIMAERMAAQSAR